MFDVRVHLAGEDKIMEEMKAALVMPATVWSADTS
jgi:hypothetical protein